MARGRRGDQSLWRPRTAARDEPVPALGQADQESARCLNSPRYTAWQQTPLERVVAAGQAGWRMTELRKLCSTLDPFQLANRIDRKLENICALRNRWPKPEASKFALRDGCRKAAPRKSPQKDFPTVLGNPTKDGRTPTSPQPPQWALVTPLFQCPDAAPSEIATLVKVIVCRASAQRRRQ